MASDTNPVSTLAMLVKPEVIALLGNSQCRAYQLYNLLPFMNISAPASTPSPPLQRGKACLSCRRRKMKCDGNRPVCTPCLRGERIEDCEYTDGQRRSRTLTLEEDVARLRARVQELEHPEDAVPPVELYAPYQGPGVPGSSARPMGHSHSQGGAYPHAGSGSAHDSRRTDPEADAHARRALSVIAPYAAELGFFLSMDRLRVQGAHILPALKSALTLWSVDITSTSGPDPVQASERAKGLTSNLLTQAQNQLASALITVDAELDPATFLHVIQAGVLLAYYMQRIGQVAGARYYASGTWALAAVLKLRQCSHLCGAEGGGASGRGRCNNNLCAAVFTGSAGLAPAMDEIEVEERVRALWAVYSLDRWFNAVGQGPGQSLGMEGSGGDAMMVSWPGVGGTNESVNVVRQLLSNPNHDFTHDGPLAMHAKASVLLGEATSIVASYTADHTVSQSATFRQRFGTLDALLQRCLNVAMTVATGRQSPLQEQAQALVTVHLIAFAHVIFHRPFVSSYGPSRRRCIDAALGVVRVLDRRAEMGAGVGNQSPIYAIVWTALCLVLYDEIRRFRARPDPDPSRRREESEMVAAIRKLVGRLSILSQGCPSRFFAIKIEAVLSILQSIAV